MKNKLTTKDLKDELTGKKPHELFSLTKNLNTYATIREFERDGVDTKELLRFAVAQLLKHKLRVPVQGYYDLADLVNEAKVKTKK